ncbi:hypothetical protein HN51_022479 [Arachis hypogaea]
MPKSERTHQKFFSPTLARNKKKKSFHSVIPNPTLLLSSKTLLQPVIQPFMLLSSNSPFFHHCLTRLEKTTKIMRNNTDMLHRTHVIFIEIDVYAS